MSFEHCSCGAKTYLYNIVTVVKQVWNLTEGMDNGYMQGRLQYISDGAHAPFEKLGGKEKVKTWGGSNNFDIIYFTY